MKLNLNNGNYTVNFLTHQAHFSENRPLATIAHCHSLWTNNICTTILLRNKNGRWSTVCPCL